MNIDDFFEAFTGGNSNVSTWTPKAIKEFAEDYHKQKLRLYRVSKPFKVVDIDLFDYTQITILNEEEKYVVCHMYTMDNMDIDRVRKQAQTMCDTLNVC